ncbi:DNA polymerase III subunit alpha [Kitasatospora aureofaciens]|uniref:DNA polymerase III subunit alpha n=1 Tax=Kitasatospora aureofaciens TaxID=1894 RepID=UPI001C46C5FD|nr:DNA polymerase III subunit alpha [Kitasatospora aureofaciens]MBV6695616.1 DNA polymerase III subunit alpha [Kitasatospora aureofaciens]
MFTHLHVASGYSVRYGASLPDALVEHAAEQGLGALSITDRDTVSGVVRFAQACAKAGIRPVFGADLAVPRLQPPAGAAGVRPRNPARGGAFVDESAPRITLLARDRTGWANLCALITAAWAARAQAGGGQPVVPWPALHEHAAGLTALLGPASEPIRALAQGRPDKAADLLAPWRDIYGPHLRLEAVHHRRTGTGPGSLRLAARTVGLAADLDLLAVLTNAVRYAAPVQARIADVLDSARLLMPVQPGTVDNGERDLKDAASMAELAEEVARAAGREHGGAAHLLATTARTADDCRLDPAADLGLGRVHFPEEDQIGAAPGTSFRVLRERCEAAMVRLGYDRSPTMRHRLDEELRVIQTLGWPTYFLTVAQVVDDVREMGIRVQARGSGAGSLVVHLLGISFANPLDHGLIMERFLNLRRHSLPDIDIDVESARRLDVYRRILDRFGAERVCTLSMPETYRVRWAIRDSGLALGMPPDEVDRLAKAFPHITARSVKTALAELPELREVAAHADRYGRLWDLVEGLDALPRGTAMHPCGVILSDATLLQRTPVMPTAGEGFPGTPFDKEDVEIDGLGLLKLDVLGVRMQSSMAYAVQEIERTTGKKVDLDDRTQVPLTDPAAFELLREGESIGVFQLESPGQKELLGRLQPTTFEDLIAEISLFRPGPVQADMIKPFILGRHGRRPVTYPHPDLEPWLASTYGVVIFNEQVAGLFATMTRSDLAMGEEARRALAKPERIPALEAWCRQRASEAGYEQQVVDEVWKMLENMGAYGFAKAHAVAFALPTLQSAWLKSHFPAAFATGLLEHDPGMYPKRYILADARRRGVPILPLDVQHSGAHYRTELDPDGRLGIRISLADVHGISQEQAERIAAHRPYGDVGDFWVRARPSLPIAERLARIGALDTLAPGVRRRDLLLQLDELHRQHAGAASPEQMVLTPVTAPTDATGLPDMTPREQLQAELEVIGMDASRHLMEPYHPLLAELGVTPAHRLGEVPTGETVLVAGAKIAIQTPPMRSGRRTIFVSLDDGSQGGQIDLAFFDDTHEQAAHVLFHHFVLLARGTVSRRGKSATIVGSRAWNLTDVADAHQQGGTAAVRRLLADQPTTQGAEQAQLPAPQPADAPSTPARRERAGAGRLFHASPGSAG